jgi:hypothetical protein
MWTAANYATVEKLLVREPLTEGRQSHARIGEGSKAVRRRFEKVKRSLATSEG